ncbi:uncharacterized protein RJT20DRAFT_684 [Scheffersomyces xylosifermentans]|uniref:uncharacterized protein n=1 Tax=Scheffersomyces xylosifermentans TaxID=1304137 RepID=UPI00315D83FF
MDGSVKNELGDGSKLQPKLSQQHIPQPGSGADQQQQQQQQQQRLHQQQQQQQQQSQQPHHPQYMPPNPYYNMNPNFYQPLGPSGPPQLQQPPPPPPQQASGFYTQPPASGSTPYFQQPRPSPPGGANGHLQGLQSQVPPSQQLQQPPPPPPQQIPLQNMVPPGQPMYSNPQQHVNVDHLNAQSRKRPVPPTGPSSRVSATYPRKRALTACDTCRLKKIKCDNVRPRCGSCMKNGNTNCHYRTDDQQKDYSSYDPASLNILTKLDVILKDLRDIKSLNGIESSSPEESSKRRRHSTVKGSVDFHFDNCFWDMSITSILKWNYFTKCFGDTPADTEAVTNTLVKEYNRSSIGAPETKPLEERLQRTKWLETLMSRNFSTIVNSFFVNCHSKIPVLDTLELFESFEIHRCLISHFKEFPFTRLLEIFDSENTDPDYLPAEVVQALTAQHVEITPYRRKAFRTLCKSIPVIIIICALGIISTPVQLDNLSRFDSSIDERNSLEIGCLSDPAFLEGGGLENLPKSRLEIANNIVKYAEFLSTVYPYTIVQSSLRNVEYYLLLSQYYLYTMTPLLAYRSISTASQNMMYYITMGEEYSLSASKKETVDRLFWSCLKLECELRVELSPYVPLSGITQISPPTSFPKIPDPMTEEVKHSHSEACIKLAHKYDDEHSWYYFLTEIAVRKVDNKMFDEIYSYDSTINKLWDQESFSNEGVWIMFIKYLNQYNGIINSLSPQIRNFVLQEINVEQIHRRMKKKYEKKQSNLSNDNDIFDNLDDFLIDDDLLIRAQSETIMFIKTRIITSKLLLFRPIIYLILENRIPITEIMEAAMSVMSSQVNITSVSLNDLNSMESPESSAGSTSNTFSGDTNPSEIDMEMDYFNLINAPLFYQRQYPDEDFTNIIEYTNKESTTGLPEDDTDEENNFKLKSIPLARSRILRIFIQNLISLPKLNIPKLGAHRHPGSWYYLRNLFIGNVFQFLLLNKMHEMLQMASNDEGMKAFIAQVPEISSMNEVSEMFNLVLNKSDIIAGFEHSLILFEYWKDEIRDCEIYYNYIKRCIEKLEVVGRVMKKALPQHAKLSKESKECVQECVSEFISFITSQAADKCKLEKRKTLNGEDILWSMFILGFENYAETLKIYLAKYRQFEQAEAMARPPKKKKRKKPSKLATQDNIEVDNTDEFLEPRDYDDYRDSEIDEERSLESNYSRTSNEDSPRFLEEIGLEPDNPKLEPINMQESESQARFSQSISNFLNFNMEPAPTSTNILQEDEAYITVPPESKEPVSSDSRFYYDRPE